MILSARAFALLIATGLLFVAAVAAPELAAMGFILDGVILVAAIIDYRHARDAPLDVARHINAVVHQGERVEIVLEIGNPRPRARRVRVRDVLSPKLLTAPFEVTIDLPARSLVEHRFVAVPRERGDDTLDDVGLRVLGPWQLAWATRRVALGQSIRVYPRRRFGDETDLVVRQAVERRLGAHAVARRGISSELYALREYQAGDDYRQLHWKASARRHRPIVRESVWEQHQQLLILIDAGRPMAALSGVETKLDHALGAALALIRVTLAQGDEATLVLFSKEVRRIVRVDRRTRSFAAIFEQLYGEAADLDEPDYPGVVAWCAHRMPRRSLALLITSVVDLSAADELRTALTGLAARHRPLLVNLEDPDLLTFAESIPHDIVGAYAKTSALAIRAADRALNVRLRSQGIESLEAPADRLALGMIQRYLDLKAHRRF